MNQTALITGASSGIGAALAKVLAAEGYNLVLIARREEKLQIIKNELEHEYNISVHFIAEDLSNPLAPQDIYKTILEAGIAIDLLVNNAGFGDHGAFFESERGVQTRMIDLNVRALTELSHLFGLDMKKRGNGGIINIASTAAFQPGPYMSTYYATKAYVLSFSEALAEELQGSGVSVTCICPGPTDSEFQSTASIEDTLLVKGNSLPSAYNVALYAYASFIKGKIVAVPGFINFLGTQIIRLLPRFVVRKIVARLQK